MKEIDIEKINKKTLKKIIKRVFEHFNRNIVYKDEFYEYFREKGLNNDEIDELWIKVITELKKIEWGVHFFSNDFPPKNIKRRPYIKWKYLR